MYVFNNPSGKMYFSTGDYNIQKHSENAFFTKFSCSGCGKTQSIDLKSLYKKTKEGEFKSTCSCSSAKKNGIVVLFHHIFQVQPGIYGDLIIKDMETLKQAIFIATLAFLSSGAAKIGRTFLVDYGASLNKSLQLWNSFMKKSSKERKIVEEELTNIYLKITQDKSFIEDLEYIKIEDFSTYTSNLTYNNITFGEDFLFIAHSLVPVSLPLSIFDPEILKKFKENKKEPSLKFVVKTKQKETLVKKENKSYYTLCNVCGAFVKNKINNEVSTACDTCDSPFKFTEKHTIKVEDCVKIKQTYSRKKVVRKSIKV